MAQSGAACYNALLATLDAGIRRRSGYSQIRYRRKMTELSYISTGSSPSRQPGGWNEWLRGALPLVLLLLALGTLFLFGGDREYFYRGSWHDDDSSRTLALAENLSFRHSLLLFEYQSRDADGNPYYPVGSLYNRFPVSMYALVKLSILPFGDDAFRAKIYAARMLMLLLFSAAAVLAYHSLARITGSRWTALTATLLAFSAYYPLYYADMIFSGATIDLFGVMLAFHGMTVFVQEGRFRQLLVKSCVALLLGWHVYAFLLPFIVFGLAAELLKARRFYPPRALCNLKRYVSTLLHSRYLLLGVVTLLFGIAILTFNFSNEYFALDGAVSLREQPSVRSMVKRFGGSQDYNIKYAQQLEAGDFVLKQFYRVAVMALPYALNPYDVKGIYANLARHTQDRLVVGLGIVVAGCCLAGLVGARRRPGTLLLLATLAVSGFCWAVLMSRSSVTNDFESVFYIGMSLTVFALALRCLRRIYPGVPGGILAPALALAALAVFIASASAMAGVGQNREQVAAGAEGTADYAVIRNLAAEDDATLYIQFAPLALSHGGAAWDWAFFLAGKAYITADQPGPRKPKENGDYLLMLTREDNPALLTPENRHVFLYDWSRYAEWLRTVDRGAPIITAGNWEVYLRDGHLAYVAQECADQVAPFFVHLTPERVADLPATRYEHGYDNRDFTFQMYGGIRIDGTCVIERALPEYDIIAIRTGQYTEAGRIWEGEYRVPAP